jgi:hypothetical protein
MSDLYTKETLTKALEWLAARRDMVTGTVIDQYVAQLPTVAHGVPSVDHGRCEGCGAVLNPKEIESYGSQWCHVVPVCCGHFDAGGGCCGNPDPSPCGPVHRFTDVDLLTSHRAPSDDVAREALELAQWGSRSSSTSWRNCPDCHRCPDDPRGHAEDCKIGKALAALTKEKS